jgi:nucleoside-diphosphate-sugar epimerase
MRVLLTGGSGSVGKAVIDRMVKLDYSVLVIGRREGMSFEGADYQACDINDYARLREVIRGCTAVIHLAAIANPGAGTPEQVFAANAQGTFNVFQAAAEEGIRKVVQASSINATGQFYGLKPAPIDYLPMDEAHEVFSTDAYSFSKHIIEEIGEYFWRREGISSVAYRLPWVAPAEQHERMGVRRDPLLPLVDQLLAKSADERLAWFETAWQAYNQFRATRPYETKGLAMQQITELPEDQRAAMRAMSSRVNFFTMLDERDSALAMELGLTAEYSGAHTLFINDSHNWSGIPSATLAELFYPDVKTFKKPLVGTETLVSIDRARQLIGFEPEFSFDQG